MPIAALPSRYRILEEVGQGGMAVVYRAQDDTLKREVAVKVLHPHLLAEPESKARLEREAHAVAKLNHDNILQIFDFSGADAPTSYIVTEFIDGETLKQFTTTRQLVAPELAALLLIELGSALHHAHALGIIHRDLKPENVMLRRDGTLKLMDFGVAQVVDLERMTVTGQILGSPAYLAPEVLDGRALDFRSDVFSAGVILYQLSTGQLPFTGRNPHEVLRRVAEGKCADPRTINRLITDSLARTISRALSRNPEDRFSSIEEMVEELKIFTSNAGLQNTKEELRLLITRPQSYQKELIPRIVSSLVLSGHREQVAHHGARALELWNRALAFDPNNKEVLSELQRLERKERKLRLALGAIITLAISGIGLGCYFSLVRGMLLQEKNHIPFTPFINSPIGSPIPVTPTTSSASPARFPQNNPHSSSATNPILRDPKRPINFKELSLERKVVSVSPSDFSDKTEHVTLTLGFSPARVEVWWNDKYSFNFGPKQNRITLPWNKNHRLEFRNDSCCSRKEVVVGPQTFRPPNDHLFIILDPKPALLSFHFSSSSAPDSLLVREIVESEAEAWKARAVPGETLLVPFISGEEMRKKIEVVTFQGEKTKSHFFQLSAGENRTITISTDE